MRNIITLKIIIFLYVLSSGASDELDQRCKNLTNVQWAVVCHGTITSEMKLKYKDQMTSIGTPFTVMISRQDNTGFLVTFYDSFMLNCKELHIDKNAVATCGNKGNYTIKPNMVYCFQHFLYYVTELMQVCYDPTDYDISILPIRFAALHYAYIPPLEAGKIALDITPKWLLHVIVAMLVWLIVMKSRPNGQMNSGIAYFILIIQLTHGAKLREGCEPLLKSTWVDVCNGIVTKEIKIKYKDQLTKVGTPYKIMSLANQEHAYLITFFKSDIQHCDMIDINENMTMTCAKTKLIKMKPRLFHCFNFGLEYLTDLMDLCFDQSDRLPIPISHGMFTVLHYSHKPPLISAQVRLSTVDSDVVGFIIILTAVFMSLMRINGICL